MHGYSTYTALALYRDWADRGKYRPLAAARYWLRYGVGESGCDHDYLRAWLDRWWSRLPAAEQHALESWMDAVHRNLESSALRYVAARRAREERIARAMERWSRLTEEETNG